MKNSVNNVIITGDLNTRHTDFNCSKSDDRGIVLKQALYNEDLFIAENEIPTYRDSRNNSSYIVGYVISSPAIYNNIQDISINNDFHLIF